MGVIVTVIGVFIRVDVCTAVIMILTCVLRFDVIVLSMNWALTLIQ